MDEWMSTGEIADELGVSTRTVRRLLDEDKVPRLELAKKWRVKRSDFEKLLASRTKN